MSNIDTQEERRRYEAAAKDADMLRDWIGERTGLKPHEIKCPREKSFSTPCVGRDGRLAVVMAPHGGICVGCERAVADLLNTERTKHTSSSSKE